MARRWWAQKYSRPAEDPAFARVIPEEAIAGMINDLHDRRDALKQLLANPAWPDREGLQKELASIESALGLRGEVGETGDKLTDYWIRRTLAGELTEEDLELMPEDIP